MPRRRIHKEDAWLPTRVYRGKSAYEWRPKGMKVIALCRLLRDDNKQIIEPPSQKRKVLEAYENAVTIQSQPKNIDYWLTKFLASSRFAKLGKYTRSDYARYVEILEKKEDNKSRNGVRHVFGSMSPSGVKPHHIRRYVDYWGTSGKEVTANRHLSFLQTFFGYLRQHNTGVINNPAHGITKFTESPRAVYIEDADYQKLLAGAFQSNTPYVAAAMEIAYLCGLRRHEVLQLNIEDITEDGLFVRRGKRSKNERTEISPRLQRAIDFAISLHRGIEPIKNRPLIRNTIGLRVTGTALNNAWRKIRLKLGYSNFWIHDLKKKAGTDGKDLGHMTKQMKAMYDLKPAIKKATK